MSDYTQSIDFSGKDDLNSGNASKIAKGVDLDTELALISTSLGQKLNKDTTGAGGIATQSEAEAGTLNTAVMTPLRAEQHMANWAAENDGMIADIHALDLSADALLGWDQGAGAAIGFTAGTAMAISGTTFEMSHLGIEDLADAGSDKTLFWDDSEGKTDWLTLGTGLAVTTTTLNWSASGIAGHDTFTDFVSGEHILHSGVDMIAGTGLTGGGTIDASRTLNVIGGDGITANANDIIVDLGFSYTWTGDHVFDETISISEELELTGVISPTELTADVDNYAPTGIDTCNVMRLSSDGTRTINGLAASQVAGRTIFLLNIGTSNSIVLENEDASATAANRFSTTGTGRSIGENTGVLLYYDGVSSRWRLVDV